MFRRLYPHVGPTGLPGRLRGYVPPWRIPMQTCIRRGRTTACRRAQSSQSPASLAGVASVLNRKQRRARTSKRVDLIDSRETAVSKVEQLSWGYVLGGLARVGSCRVADGLFDQLVLSTFKREHQLGRMKATAADSLSSIRLHGLRRLSGYRHGLDCLGSLDSSTKSRGGSVLRS